MPYHGINAHLEPFLPYVEKAPALRLNADWHLPDNLSRPISIATVKAWLATCDQHHGDHCRGRQSVPPDQRPAWLVDVRRACVVAAPSGVPYATLSYVWGKTASPGFSLMSATLDNLRSEGFLDDAELPKTIRDVMHLVAALGLSYLWVDRLCIVQDSDSEKHAQIKAMGAIYANSYFTIIAAQSHDASGPLSSRPLRSSASAPWLFGLVRSLSRSLISWARMLRSDDEVGLSPSEAASPWRRPQTDRDAMGIMSADLLRTIWFSRGWTFQEFLFSRRKIVFHNNTVNWECHCTSAHESRIPLSKERCSRPPVHINPLGVEIDPWPNFHRYARLASLITPRSFTFPEDVLDAFAGAATALARVYQGGLISGLPQMVFDAALIWQPYHPLERRRPVLVPGNEAVLPSWSWVSWRGNVQSESWKSGHDYLREPYREPGEADLDVRWSTYPTIQWSHSATLGSTRYAIEPETPKWRRLYLDDPATAPPAGWQKHTTLNGTRFFTHEDAPGHEFWYPIPIGISDGRALRSRYLHCRTRHARLQGEAKTYRAFASGCVVVALQDTDGNMIGSLRLNSSERLDSALLWDLIELSSGSMELDHGGEDQLEHPFADVFDEWILPRWSRDGRGGIYEFYNVMHVEWTAPGVAFRVAVGRVEKQAWERLAVQEIEVSLG